MKCSIFAKLIFLISIICFTRFATSQIVGRVERDEDLKHPTLTKTSTDLTKPQAKRKGVKPRFSSFTAVTNNKIQVQGNQIQVTAALKMKSNYPGTVHLWHVTIRREIDHVDVIDHPYVDQQFEFDSTGHLTPTFADAVELPPGRYRVTLRLYGMDKGTNFVDLSDEEKAKMAQELIKVFKVVEIP